MKIIYFLKVCNSIISFFILYILHKFTHITTKPRLYYERIKRNSNRKESASGICG